MPILSAFPGFYLLLELGVFFVVLNCICLSFVQIHARFYINYIIYYGLLIFCHKLVVAISGSPLSEVHTPLACGLDCG